MATLNSDQRQLPDPDSSFISAEKRQRRITGLVVLGLVQICLTFVLFGIPWHSRIWSFDGIGNDIIVGFGMAHSQVALLAFGLVFDHRGIYLRLLIAGFGWNLIALGVFQQFRTPDQVANFLALKSASFVFLFAVVASLAFLAIRLTRGCTLSFHDKVPAAGNRRFSLRFLFAAMIFVAIAFAIWPVVLSDFSFGFVDMSQIWEFVRISIFMTFFGTVAVASTAMMLFCPSNGRLASLLAVGLLIAASIVENWLFYLVIDEPFRIWHPFLHYNAAIVLPTFFSIWLIRFSGYRLCTNGRTKAGPMPISLPERV